jgi:nucleotide-binding universal stress UspA family protein
MKITNILLPLDGSQKSAHALDYAVYLAKQSGARIYAVNCYELLDATLEVSGVFAKEVIKSVEKHAADILEKAANLMKAEGVTFTTKALLGSPGKVLTNLAKTKEFDLIIMGSHGHSDISGLFLGSVTHKVLNTIHCPVMVVP